MNLLEIFSSVWIILYHFKPFAQAQGKFKITPVTYITELQSDGDIPNQEENILADTEEKRLELCGGGLKQIKNENKPFWSPKEKDVDLRGVSVEKMKVYVLKYANDYQVNAVKAYKCLTEPEIYIRANIGKGYDDKPIFYVIIYREKPPEYIPKQFMYKLVRVDDIIQVSPIDMLSMSKRIMGIPVRIPSFKTDELSDEQRLQICVKGMQTSSELNVELLKDKKTSKNKFYEVTLLSRNEKEVIQAFECPTEPKIYIWLNDGYMMGVVLKTMEGHRATIHTKKLTNVSDKGIKSLYHEIKKRVSDVGTKKNEPRRDQLIDSGRQNTMCRLIFEEITSDRTPGGSYNDVLPKSDFKTYKELKETNSNLFKRSYIIYEDSQIVPGAGEEIIIKNGPESTNVKVSEGEKILTEDVYVCLIRDKSYRGELEEFFFSEEYNLNTSKVSSGYLAGRFVFERVSNSDSFVKPILTMIQQFSEISETSNVELMYLERRKKQDLAKTDTDDLLCKLDNSGRSKMCTLVFHSLMTPLYEHGCARNPITFMTKDGIEEANGNQYFEWMLPCHEFKEVYSNTPTKIYYLSQAYNKSNPSSFDDVFAYSRTLKSSKIILENRYTDPRIGDLVKKNEQ